jgi:predicted transcriptional regulator
MPKIKVFRVPRFLVMFPPVKANDIYFLKGEKNKRFIVADDVVCSIDNPISHLSFRILIYLISEAQKNNTDTITVFPSIFTKEILNASRFGGKNHKIFQKALVELKNISYTLNFKNYGDVPKYWLNLAQPAKPLLVAGEKFSVRIRNLRVLDTITDVYEETQMQVPKKKKRGRGRPVVGITVRLASSFYDMIKDETPYVRLINRMLNQIDSHSSIELLTFFLCFQGLGWKESFVHTGKHILGYYFGMTHSLIEHCNSPEKAEKISVFLSRQKRKIYRSLDKMKELGIIDDWDKEEDVLIVGKQAGLCRSVKFIRNLILTYNQDWMEEFARMVEETKEEKNDEEYEVFTF